MDNVDNEDDEDDDPEIEIEIDMKLAMDVYDLIDWTD